MQQLGAGFEVVLPTLASLQGDADGRGADFFRLYAQDLPDELASKCLAIGQAFVTRHARTRLGPLFNLTLREARSIAETAGGLDKDDASGWINSFEQAAGFLFTERTVPQSDLYAIQTPSGEDEKGEATKLQKKPRTTYETIGQQLTSENRLWTIPEYCYTENITTLDPLTTEIEETELTLFTDSVIEAILEDFGRYNIGRPMCRTLGMAAEKRLPKICQNTLHSRRIWKVLYNKTKNRKHVRRIHAPRPPPRDSPPACACLPAEGLPAPPLC